MRSLVAAVVFLCIVPEGVNAQDSYLLSISITPQAHFVVTDPDGRKTGRDPRGAEKPWQGRPIREIPGASYATFSVGDAPTDYQADPRDLQFEFTYRVKTPDGVGDYGIEVIGFKIGEYRLYVDVDPKPNSNLKARKFARAGVIGENQTVSYVLRSVGSLKETGTLAKVASVITLQQDLSNCYKLELLGQRELYSDLSHRVDKFEKYLSHKDSLEARHELLKLKEKIDDVYKKSDKRVDKKKPMRREFISEDAYKILNEDISALLEQLPEHTKGKGWEKRDEKGGKEKGRD